MAMVRAAPSIKPAFTLKICPAEGTVKPRRTAASPTVAAGDRACEGDQGELMVNRPDELTVLKALGDETRYAMYRELATSTAPLSAPELAERLGLHANTVRLHLDRLRDAGLIEAEAVHRGTVGRPQHLYFLAGGAPGLGFDPPAHALLAGLLASLAERVGADPDDAADT